jgi:flagellar biosynthetic protein FliP
VIVYVVLLVILAAATLLIRRRGVFLTRHGSAVDLRVLQRTALGPRQGVALVQVGDRVLVVSQSDGAVRMLTELTGEALTRALTPARSVRQSGGGRRWWQTVTLLLALTAGTQTAAAQQPPPEPAGPSAALVASRRATPSVALPPSFDLKLGGTGSSGGFQISGAVGVVLLMAVLTLLPTLFLLMTSFSRFLVVLHFLRTAIGTQTAPPGQLLVAIAVILTGFTMQPVLDEANRSALQPYLEGTLTQEAAFTAALLPFRRFMLANTRERDLGTFAELAGQTINTPEELPTPTVMGAFITSELRTAFQIGFVIFLPFVVVDLIVASVLTSLGMFMLPPVMVSLPFKLLLFVLADGWTLVVQNLVAGYQR